MTWLAIGTGTRALIRPAPDPAALLPQGSLWLETLFQAGPGPQSVLEMERLKGWPRALSVELAGDGTLSVRHRQDRQVSQARLTLPAPPPARDTPLRIAYAWDAPTRRGWLWLQDLDSGRIATTAFDDPMPLPLADVAAFLTPGRSCRTDPALSLVAVSDRVMPLTGSLGMTAETPVATAKGVIPAGRLAPGDLVHTAGGDLKPVRNALHRTVPAIGHLAPVRLRAPYFGLTEDICLAPDHRLLITGADAEYLFGSDGVLVEARHLALMAGGRARRAASTVAYTQILLDGHDCLAAAGAWCETLYFGAETAALAKEHPPAAHTRPAGLPLRPYEAMALVSAMCA